MALSGFDLNENKPPLSDGSLVSAYLDNIQKEELRLDPDQQQVIEELQTIYTNIVKHKTEVVPKKSLLSLFKKSSSDQDKRSIKGLYLYGGVGRGKTYLVDFFFDRLPIEKKMRLHFHRFMQIVHEELAKIDGVENPLKQVAENFLKQSTSIMF